jgi:anti-anti-sigma factor
MPLRELKCGAVHVLRPEGTFKGPDAEELQVRITQLLASDMGRCVVDASAIQFVDSKALEALVDASEAVDQVGRSLKLCGVQATVREVLELTDLAAQFEYYVDVNAAVRSFL